MVLVNVQGDVPFDISDKDVAGSKTIENVLQYNNQYNINLHTPIPLGINLDDWYAYQDFLDNDQPSFTSLKVIDYLDNVIQARNWCELKYKSLREQQREQLYSNFYFVNILTQMIDEYTEFTPKEVLPFELFTSFEWMLTRIKSIGDKELPFNYVNHIVNTLYSRRVASVYHEANGRRIYDMTAGYIRYLENEGFILKSVSGLTAINHNKVLHEYSSDYYYNNSDLYKVRLKTSAKFISSRIATYYSNINIYDVGCHDFIYCPNDKPHLNFWLARDNNEPKSIRYVSCQSTIPENYGGREPVHFHSPNSNYKPHDGFQTGIKIKDYTDKYDSYDVTTFDDYDQQYDLLTYNLPSMYDRDYYIYLPYEYDPIAKIVYAFSI